MDIFFAFSMLTTTDFKISTDCKATGPVMSEARASESSEQPLAFPYSRPTENCQGGEASRSHFGALISATFCEPPSIPGHQFSRSVPWFSERCPPRSQPSPHSSSVAPPLLSPSPPLSSPSMDTNSLMPVFHFPGFSDSCVT